MCCRTTSVAQGVARAAEVMVAEATEVKMVVEEKAAARAEEETVEAMVDTCT